MIKGLMREQLRAAWEFLLALVTHESSVIVLPVLALAPQADTPGIVDKLIIDATTPIAPDNRGNYDNQVHDLPEMGQWLAKLQQLAANR